VLKLLSTTAPAKINLFLRFTGRRADGYHELDSLFVPVSLCDRVAIALRSAATSSVVLRCDAAGLGPDDQNLAVRAARAFMAEFAITADVMIDLHKEIPAGAGLGGGSSDAGAVLRMMAQLCHVGDRNRLGALAVKLGADVPFFLDPAPARVHGIGELIEPFDQFAPVELVIAVPPLTVPTADVFKRLPREAWSGPASSATVDAIATGRVHADQLVNDLAGVAKARWPVIAELQKSLEHAGAIAAAMSGSGGAVFGVFATASDAARAAEEIRARNPAARVFAVSTLTNL
jgi:4-diphosphocytidyl-2-C-methyl-D-erythritol kinase